MRLNIQSRDDVLPTIQSAITKEEAERQVVSDLMGFTVWELMRGILAEEACSRGRAVAMAVDRVPDEMWGDGLAKNFLRFEAHKAYTHLTKQPPKA